MLRCIVTLFIIFSLFFSSYAVEVPINIAQEVAENFLIKQEVLNPVLKNENLKVKFSAVMNMKNSSKAALYIFDISKTGFIIIAGDDNVYPILGYSLTNTLDLDNLSPSLEYWLTGYVNQISYAADFETKRNEIKEVWETYKSYNSTSKSEKFTQVNPLILTTWNQDYFYNAYCPEDPAGPGGHVYAGCVATAMAQVMKYYNYPQQGYGSHNYNDWDYGYQYADFGNTTYNWFGMPNSLNSNNNAVAELLYHCGVSVEMGYSTSGSGASSEEVVPALINYFGYSNSLDIKERHDYTDQQWIAMLKSNLDALMPLYYSGYSDEGGHAFNFDGYYDDALGTHFHINWGWGGYGNGFFYVDNLASPGGAFNDWHQAIFNIIPDQNYPQNCTGSKTVTSTIGTFDDGSGMYEYQHNTNCSWLIDPVVNVVNIKLTFDKFDTEANNDLVTVYDGDNTSATVLGVFSGSNMPPIITSTGKKILITFITDGAVKKQGWSVSYATTKPSYCSNVTLLTDIAATISDGSGIYNYNENTNCRWRIEPPNASSITLQFTEFNLQDIEDHLEVFDVSSSPYILMDTYTGSQIPAVKTYNSSKLLLWFKSLNNPKTGWSADYSAVVSVDENIPFNDGISIYPNPANDAIHIDIDKPYAECEIRIYDMSEQLVKSLNFTQSANNIDITNLKKGVYTIQLIFKNEILMRRFIKF